MSNLENNLTLAVIVFVVGMLATLATAVFVALAHRHWATQERATQGRDQ